MKNKILLTILSLLTPLTALAGTGNGLVQIETIGFAAAADKSLMFFYTENHISPPGCASYSGLPSGSKRWALNMSTELGQQQYSFLLAAQMRGKKVYITGTNSCTMWVDAEDVSLMGFLLE
ncbi:MAG: hypothetical protein ACI9FJ_000008 [Alteromonadaceae bacterium]|jgi:hypothetical protein